MWQWILLGFTAVLLGILWSALRNGSGEAEAVSREWRHDYHRMGREGREE